jgi:hypothetical protein
MELSQIDPATLFCPTCHRRMTIISAESSNIDLKVYFKCFTCQKDGEAFLEHVLHLPSSS